MVKQKLFYGIDLGTTNSCIAVYQAGISKAIPLDNSRITTLPSCVMWLGGDKFIVGKDAYDNRYAENVAYSSKRLMGSGKFITLTYRGKQRKFSPEEIGAEILKGLVKKVSRLYKDIKDAVVCVPAYFDNNQVMATQKAIKLAGLNCLQIAKEPTSAALVYNSVGALKREKVLIYDLGGGTFDVSLVSIEPPVNSDMFGLYGLTNVNKTLFRVLGVDGNPHLGGDDIDDLLTEKCLKDLGVTVEELPNKEIERIKLFCERAKKAASLESTYYLDHKGETLKATIDINDIRDAVERIFDKTLEPLERLIAKHGGVDSITQLITVGGSTMSSIIRENLEEELPSLKKNYSLNSDESVALGAAIQAAVLSDHGDLHVVDCLAGNYGISLSNGVFKPILKDGTPIPANNVYIASTETENQTDLNIHFFQGMSPYALECSYIGSIFVDNIKAGLVIVDMTVDSNGLLVVKVSDSEGVSETKQLVNVLGRDKESLTTVDRKLNRWTLLAKKHEDEKLLELIQSYAKCKTSDLERRIITTIKSYTSINPPKHIVFMNEDESFE